MTSNFGIDENAAQNAINRLPGDLHESSVAPK